MFSKFDEEAQKVLIMSRKEMLELKHPYVGSEHLLLSILNNDSDINSFFSEYEINYNNIRDEIIKIIGIGSSEAKWFLYTPLLKRIIENAILDSRDNTNEITVKDLFVALLEEGDGVANRILMGMNIDIDALHEAFTKKYLHKNKKYSNKLLIDKYSVNFNNKALEGDFDPVIGRNEEINRVIEVLLRRTKNNPLLIGEAGVGKTALIEELARRIEKGIVPSKLKNKVILGVSMASVISGTKYRGEFEERITKIIDEISNDDSIILFIDEIHTIVGAGSAEGAIDASNILKPYLARGNIKVIGATTNKEYSKYLEKDRALDRRFQKIFIEETSLQKTEQILMDVKQIYEDYHGIEIPDSIIKQIVSFSDRYITKGKNPDKVIDILDEVCTKTAVLDDDLEKKTKERTIELNNIIDKKNLAIVNHNFKEASYLKEREVLLKKRINKLKIYRNRNIEKKKVSMDVLYDVIYFKTKIPIKKFINLDKNRIKKKLKEKVIGQDEVINEMVDSIDFDYNYRKRKPKSFLFVGKSGVGKTFLAQEYAKNLYPEEAYIKLDMSEYKDDGSISKILGSNPGYVGYEDKNTVLEKIKENPYSVLLLDEIEKAGQGVIKLFLQVLDDGYMTSSFGEKIDFSNCIIFMTSNLGCGKESIGFVDRKNIILEKIKLVLSSEIVNRIDSIFIFNDLSKADINKIIRKKLDYYCEEHNLDINRQKCFKIIKDKINYNTEGVRQIDKIIYKELSGVISGL